jgi:cysteine desulfurase family protein (TIGR01976 family)
MQRMPSIKPVTDIRAEFPGLRDGTAALDGAAGTQVPDAVIAAVSGALATAMANLGGPFAASGRSVAVVAAARRAVADLVGGVPDGVVLGPSMATLTFHFADALAREWGPGDEVVVTSLDHDANVRPWVLAAERAGATVRMAEFDVDTGELRPEAFDGVIGDRTRLVAVTAASNAIGTRPDVRAIADRAHEHGALVYVDGVHATPHVPTDVAAIGADLYAFSTYKLYGPHAACVVASPELLERIQPAKLAPSSNAVPWRFERGTPPFELIAGITAAIDWLADLAHGPGTRRERLLASMTATEERLAALVTRMAAGLRAIDGVRVLPAGERRTSTVSFLVDGYAPADVSAALAREGVAVWDGDNYAYELMRRFGLAESGGAVRASLVVYNDDRDVDRLLTAVAGL